MTTALSALDLSALSIPSTPSEFALSISATPPSVPSAPAITYNDATIGSFTNTTLEAVPTPPTYTKPTNSVSFTNIVSYIGTKQDLEKAQTEIQHQTTVLNSYNGDIINELNEFNSQMENQKIAVNHIIRQAELTQQMMIDKSKSTTEINIQNEAQAMAGLIANYQAVLSKYSADLNRYQQIVNAEVTAYSTNLQRYNEQLNAIKTSIDKAVQEYRANLELWQTKRQTELSQYTADIQNEQNDFQKELAEYQATVQKAMRQAELDQERLMLSASKTTDLSIQNKAQNLNASIELYKGTLELYSLQINSYSQDVNKAVNKYSNTIQKYLAQIEANDKLIEQCRKEYQQIVSMI